MITIGGIAPFNKDYKEGNLCLVGEPLLAITFTCSMKYSTSEAVRLWLCLGCGCDTTIPARKKPHSPHRDGSRPRWPGFQTNRQCEAAVFVAGPEQRWSRCVECRAEFSSGWATMWFRPRWGSRTLSTVVEECLLRCGMPMPWFWFVNSQQHLHLRRWTFFT